MPGRKYISTLFALLFAMAPLCQLSSAPWPAIREFGGANPKNQDTWVDFNDYPAVSIRHGEQGNVIVTFDITADGKAINCVVESSSGHPSLDRVPCPLIERKARFDPALGNDGAPTATKARYSVAFWIPE
jgi:protein TonB